MDREIKQWKLRVEKRNAEVAKEKAVRDTIFAELKQEFGYEIDPEDPMFKVMYYVSCVSLSGTLNRANRLCELKW